MKGRIKQFVGLAILFTAISSTAQVALKGNVTVPFAFKANGQLCPAGEYGIAINKNNDVVTLTRQGYTQAVVLGTGGGASTDQQSYLRFQQVGQEMFLREVAVSGETETLPLPKNRRPKSEVARSTTQPAISKAGVE